MKNWKCLLIPKGESCHYEQFQSLLCCACDLKKAAQELRFSLPLVGKYFRRKEKEIKCNGWKK